LAQAILAAKDHAAFTVSHESAHIGFARSTFDDCVVNCLDALATALGVKAEYEFRVQDIIRQAIDLSLC
jgi:tRNA A37 threonylcarbamoyltransferase TsaD